MVPLTDVDRCGATSFPHHVSRGLKPFLAHSLEGLDFSKSPNQEAPGAFSFVHHTRHNTTTHGRASRHLYFKACREEWTAYLKLEARSVLRPAQSGMCPHAARLLPISCHSADTLQIAHAALCCYDARFFRCRSMSGSIENQ